MGIKSKTFSSRSEIDDVYESAVEWQERARQNHGITLDLKDCIEMVLKFGCASAMSEVSKSLETILDMIKAEKNAGC